MCAGCVPMSTAMSMCVGGCAGLHRWLAPPRRPRRPGQDQPSRRGARALGGAALAAGGRLRCHEGAGTARRLRCGTQPTRNSTCTVAWPHLTAVAVGAQCSSRSAWSTQRCPGPAKESDVRMARLSELDLGPRAHQSCPGSLFVKYAPHGMHCKLAPTPAVVHTRAPSRA